MNNTTIAIIAGSIGLAAGAVGGFFIGKKVYEAHYALIAEEEIASVREEFSKRVYEAKDAREQYDNKGETPAKVEPAGKSFVRSSIEHTAAEKAKKAYNLAYSSEKIVPSGDESAVIERNVFDDQGDNEALSCRNVHELDRTLPYFIDDEEFANEFDHHDKISLYYHVECGTLVDEQEEVITEIEITVGTDAIDELEGGSSPVWVRNEPLTIDYEIMRVPEAFQKTIKKPMSPREEKALKDKAKTETRKEKVKSDGK